MKRVTLAIVTLAALGACLPASAQAADAAAAPAAASPWAFSANLGLLTDYRFRGISQTDKKPALQGGFDLAHESGIYIGNWNSNIDSAMYNGANLEMDFYGGWKKSFDGGFGIDLGAIYYYYPGSGDNPSGSTTIDNTELYIGASWGPLTAKYSYAVSDFFGAPDSKGSSYLDLGFAYDLGKGFGFVAHYGYQYLKGDARVAEIGGSFPGPNNVSDWKLGVTYTFDGWALALAYIDTNRSYTAGTAALTNKNISGATGVLSLSRTF